VRILRSPDYFISLRAQPPTWPDPSRCQAHCANKSQTNHLDEHMSPASNYNEMGRLTAEPLPVFTQLNPATGRRQYWLRTGSLALHAVALVWLLHAPEPKLLNPQSVALGENGASVTRLYWSSKSPDDSTHSSSDLATVRYKHERLGQKLTWKAPAKPANLPALTTPLARAEEQDSSKTQTLSALGHGAQAGARYGTLTQGQLYGDEVRPALPIATSDPVVYPWQLPTAPGNEVIEITIDERGEITNKTVLQSLGPDIDTKCLAALENWHFHPATRNGAPIASKQDAIFPFKARG